MKCNKCGEELQELEKKCPACGAPVEEPQAKKEPVMVPLKMVLLIGVVVLLAVVMVGVVLMGMLKEEAPDAPTVQTTQPAPTIPADGNPEDVTCKGSYTLAADKLIHSTVAATMGKHQLTNGQLQVFYWMQVYDFINYYSYYLSAVGLDYTKPLDMQACGISEEKITWQQFFLDQALDAWQNYRLLADRAEQEGWKLPAGYQSQLDGLEESLKKDAQEGKYESVEAMLAAQMGAGITLEDYANYVNLYYVGNLYRDYLISSAEFTDAELEDYFKEHEAELKQNSPSITKDSGLLVDVRHILVTPKGGTPSADGKTVTYSDAEWEACRAAAQAIYDQWLAGEKTEASFGTLANEKSEDQNGQVTNGGIYTNVVKGQMVKEFDDWCFDATRKPGDHGMVKTVYGYHVMYYVAGEEGWVRFCRQGVQKEKVYAMEDKLNEDNPLKADYSSIGFAAVDFSVG